MARPRVLKLREPGTPPKKKCVRGHVQRKVGWSLHRVFVKGKWYTARRCLACLLSDVQKSTKRQKKKRRRRVAKRLDMTK